MPRYVLWIMMEVAIIGSDIQEVLAPAFQSSSEEAEEAEEAACASCVDGVFQLMTSPKSIAETAMQALAACVQRGRACWP